MSKSWSATLKLPKSTFPYVNCSAIYCSSQADLVGLARDLFLKSGTSTSNDVLMVSMSGRGKIALPRTLLCSMMAPLTPMVVFTLAMP